MAKRVYVGPAGWSYEDWKGIVYPAGRAPLHPVTFLSRYIDIVEVNSTFYRMPEMGLTLSWVKKLDPGRDFLFAVKLHQVFTHERKDFSTLEVDAFKRGIDPLAASRRLAALLLQFPWSYHNTPAHREYLAGLFRLFAGYPLSVEVRHGSWDDPAFYGLLRENGAAYCNIDQPVIGNSLKPSAVVTTPAFAYVRLHGRNYQNWFREGAGRDARYDYLYAKDELEEWVERIRAVGRETDRIYVITNNHYRGQALANALQIKNLTSGKKVDVPLGLLKQYPVLEEIVERIRKGQLDLFGSGTAEGPEETKKD